jgi:hypothetical protein
MKIASVSLEGISGLPNQSFALALDLCVIAGPPGSGKTRLLEAILAAKEVVGPYVGMVREEDWVADPARGATLTLELSLDAAERELCPGSPRARVELGRGRITHEADRGLQKLLSRYEHSPASGKFEYFAENRQLAWGARADGLGEMEQLLARVGKDAQKYGFLSRLLRALRRDESKGARFVSLVERLAPSLSVTIPTSDDDDVFFASRGRPVFLSQLSSAEAEAVIFAGTAVLVELHSSVVLVDRPELYVHTERLPSFVEALGTLGTDNQLILATGSPVVVEAAGRARVHSLGALR